MSEVNTEIPSVSEIYQEQEMVPQQVQPSVEMTEEERERREAYRTDLIRQCRDYIQSYIEQKAPGKIRYRNNVLKMTNAYVFRFSPPAQRGKETRFFSQVMIDTNKNGECKLAKFRPHHHPENEWYFPIFYMMNGFTKNPDRTFACLSLTPVQDQLRKLFESKGYTVDFRYVRNYRDPAADCNVVHVEWPPQQPVA